MRAVLHYPASTGFRRRLHDAAPEWLQIEVVEQPDGPAILQALASADVLLHALTPVTPEMFASGPHLKLIQKIGVGTNTIDLEVARERGIAVANMPGSNSQAVAEHTLALLLAVLRRLGDLDRATRRGAGWTLPPDLYDGVGEVCGRTVGLVGFGSIPQRLAPVLAALGARVLYYSRRPLSAGDLRWVGDLALLLAQSDIVSLHLPLTDETARLLGREEMAGMKPGAILVNTARGGLIEEAALVEALGSGQIAAAGLDVFATEPAGGDNPLFQLPNVLATPHVAWLTPETLDRSIAIIVDNCRRLRAGEPLLHRVV